jgi:hypothetical protein
MSKTAEPNIAKEDIEIFKICETFSDNIVKSYYRDVPYTLGKIYKMSIPIEVCKVVTFDFSFQINKGFHSYAKECVVRPFAYYCSIEIFHRDTNIGTYHNNTIKVKGYIPKGTKYYINKFGECVSEAICLTEICV